MKNEGNRGDRSRIEEGKARLPLPELLRILGHIPPSGEDGGNMQSPFVRGRRQKSPSFSIFRRGNAWGWCDRSGGQERKGDESTLLETLEGLEKAEAIARYQRWRAETEPVRSLDFGGSLGYNQNQQRHETEEKKPQCGVQGADRA